MIPFAGLKESPGIEEERTGSISHVLTTPPTLVGDSPLTGSFLVNVNGEPAYEISGASRTMSVKVSVVVAPKAVTVTVCVVLAWTSVGVPEMVPLRQFMVKPSGSSGDTSKIGLVARPCPEPWLVVNLIVLSLCEWAINKSCLLYTSPSPRD